MTTTYSEIFSNMYAVSFGGKSNATATIGASAGSGSETVSDTIQTLAPQSGNDINFTATGDVATTGTGNSRYDGTLTDGSGNVVGYVFYIAGKSYVVSDSALSGTYTYSKAASSTITFCFMAGTNIATPNGEVAVEALKAGDVVSLANGGSAPVTWLGRQSVSPLFADPIRANPIRVKANALADGVPSRDLLVSPDHALLVDGVLVQTAALVNGVSVVRETEMENNFTYYHVEVANHALILAENTPAETFIDNVDRLGFDNWDEHPGDVQLVEMDLPRAKSARQVPAGTQARLAARGAALYGLLDDAAAA
jgi:hypothetical protein